ncbi:MAG: TonB-dependent receptor [Bacteroidales bacterium]|nr:TonB-dependent receptor [Bacteroidales bacterium]
MNSKINNKMIEKKMVMEITKWQIMIVFILVISTSMAQTVQTVRGKALDRQTGSPVSNAAISVQKQDKHTISDSDGVFILENIPLGRHHFLIQHIGYEREELYNISVDAGKETYLEILLEPAIFALDEVVLTYKPSKDRAVNEMAGVSARSFSVEETERYAGSLGDPSRMVANYAGVVASGDQRNDIIIRGNSPMGVLWRVDGFSIPNPNHFGAVGTSGGPVGMLNNNLLKTSDFYTGAFPAEFGNALAGAFDVYLRNGNTKKYQFVGQVGFNGFELGAEGPVPISKESSFLINYRYSTLAVFDALHINMGLGRTIPQYQDISFKITLGKTKSGEWSLFGIGGTSYIELLDENAESNTWSYGFTGQNTLFGSDLAVVGLTNKKIISENTSIETKVSYQGQRNQTKIDTFSMLQVLSPQYRSSLGENRYMISTKIKTRTGNRNIIAGGITYSLRQPILDDYIHTQAGTVTLRDSKILTSDMESFVEYKRIVSGRLNVYGGLHYLHLFFNNTGSLEPRAGVNYRLSDRHVLRLGYGLHGQQQSFLFYLLKLRQQDGSVEMTNRNMGFSKSHHIVLGYDWLLNDNLRLKLETYYQHLFNIPVTTTDSTYSILNAGDNFYIPEVHRLENKSTGKNYGAELTFEQFFARNYYWLITASIYDSKYKGYDKIERNTAFNGNFSFNALFGYEWKITDWLRLTSNIRGVWTGSKRYIPIDVEASRTAGQAVYLKDASYENRYDDYLKIDFRTGVKIYQGKITHEFAVDLQNVSDNKNILMQSYDKSRGVVKYEYQSGFYPMALYRILF